jgi:hypothetical protein
MCTEETIERTEIMGLKWYGHAMQMDENRWPRIYNWAPPWNWWRGNCREKQAYMPVLKNDLTQIIPKFGRSST